MMEVTGSSGTGAGVMPPTPGATPRKRLSFLDGGAWDERPTPAAAAGNTPVPAVGATAGQIMDEATAAAVKQTREEFFVVRNEGAAKGVKQGQLLLQQTAVAQSPSETSAAAAVEKLKQEIAELWLHGRERRIALGRKLRQLQSLLAQRGTGTFLRTVSDPPPQGLGIPVPTMYCYIAEANEADGCYEIDNNVIDAGTVTEAPATTEISDPDAEQVEAAKESHREEVERLKKQNRFSQLYRVDFVPVTPQQRERCKAKVKQLGIANAFALFYAAIFAEPEKASAEPAGQEVAVEVTGN